MKAKTIVLLLLLFSTASAQWPGYFYAFVLKDSEGNIIDSSNKAFKMTPEKFSSDSEVLLSVGMCTDNRTWRFYEGAKDLDKTHRLKVDKLKDSHILESMMIYFPPSLSGGKEQYYRNLYAGELEFKEGVYKVGLPETGDQWDKLEEINVCPDSNNNYTFHNISGFQK